VTPPMDSLKRAARSRSAIAVRFFSLKGRREKRPRRSSRLRTRSRFCWRSVRSEDGAARCAWRTSRRWRAAEDQTLRSRDRLSPGARADAGFHRRAGVVDWPPWRDAMQAMARIRARSIRFRRRSSHRPFGMVDSFGSRASFGETSWKEYERNGERYAFLRGPEGFANFRVVAARHGICHQSIWNNPPRSSGPQAGERRSHIPTRWSAPTAHDHVNAFPCWGWGAHRGGSRPCWPAHFHADPEVVASG